MARADCASLCSKSNYINNRIFISLWHLYHPTLMPTMSERLQWLAQQFDSLIEKLTASPIREDRTQILRRMRVLIVEIDSLILSDLKRDKQETSGSPPSDQRRTPSGK
jgi:hypothetical protein